MKDDTVDLVKFRRLMRALDLREWQAVGVLESLWRFTRKNAPLGDVGRFTNVDIAAAIDWRGDADELIAVLSDGWLDASEPHRLVCHDWYDHVPNFLARRINNQLLNTDTKTATAAGKKAWDAWASGGSSPGSRTTAKAPDGGRHSARGTPDAGRNSDETRPASRARAEAQPIQSYPPPPTPASPLTTPASPWVEVVAELRSLGVTKAADAVESARLECNATQVRNVIEFYRAHAKANGWGPGALYDRVRLMLPNEAAGDHWPPGNDQPTPESKAAARRASIEKQLRQREERKAEKAAADADVAASGYDPLADFKSRIATGGEAM